MDIRRGGPEIRFITVEGVGFATTVDSLLAIKKFVYDDNKYTITKIKDALINDFEGEEFAVIQTMLKNRAPKYGNDVDKADELARKIMKVWSDETWKYKTPTNY